MHEERKVPSDEYENLAYAALVLERQLDSYAKLHAEEIRALRKALGELKQRVLQLAEAQSATPQMNPLVKEKNDDKSTT